MAELSFRGLEGFNRLNDAGLRVQVQDTGISVGDLRWLCGPGGAV